MPTVREIEAALFELAPREGTMEWDNVGHLLGDPCQEVNRCMVALDITHAVAEEAIAAGCQLIVAHHPIMNCKWSQVQTVRDDTFQGSLLTRLLRANVSVICMHTNLDIADGGVNDVLAQALDLQNLECFTKEGVLSAGGRSLWRCRSSSVLSLRPWAATVCVLLTPGSLFTGWLWAADPAGNLRTPPLRPGAIPLSPLIWAITSL